MKKVILPKLSRKEKAAVLLWLQYCSLLKIRRCPFEIPFSEVHLPKCKVCGLTFPRTSIDRDCPCHLYTLKYVIKRAKELVT